MKDSNPHYEKGIPVKCPKAQTTYDGKTALFHIERGGTLVPLKGTLVVHLDSDCVCVDIEYRGLLEQFEPPNTFGYCFHLSQAHTDSIVSVSGRQSDVEFEVAIPLLACHYIPRRSD